MARDYNINGPVLVTVTNNVIGTGIELGVCSSQVIVSPTFYHKELYSDDFGNMVPPEHLWMGADAIIEMSLVHYDDQVLYQCLAQSMGGSKINSLAGFGKPMGGGQARGAAGNHYIKLTLASPDLGQPWVFPSAFLYQRPMMLPLGVERSLVTLTWRAVPYGQPDDDGDVISHETELWTGA